MSLEDVTAEQLNNFLFKNEVWREPLNLSASEPEHVRTFIKLSMRKKLLTLIALTDKDNSIFPEIMKPFFTGSVGSLAWMSLNWVVLEKKSVNELLLNAYLTDDIRNVIVAAQSFGRCRDEFSKILDAPQSRLSCIAICQHGSLKQRASLAKKMDASMVQTLVSSSPPDIVIKSIKWAQVVEK